MGEHRVKIQGRHRAISDDGQKDARRMATELGLDRRFGERLGNLVESLQRIVHGRGAA